MKMKSLFLLFSLLLLLPTATIQAESTHQMSPFCEIDYVADQFTLLLNNVETIDDLEPVLNFVLLTIEDCGDEWLEELDDVLAELLGTTLDPIADPNPTGLNPNDGILTEEEAEFVIQTAFAGDYETANEYICPTEQIDDSDAPGGIEVSALECTSDGDRMSCDVTYTFEGITTDDSVIFEVIDGKICATINE